MNVIVTSGLAGIGHNLSPLEASTQTIDDLFLEATNWCDDDGVTTADEEKEVDKLLDLIRAANKEAEARRVAEKAPWDAGARLVQAAWMPIIKKADLAADACKKALQPYRQRIADEKAKAAEAAQLEAERLRKAAQEAMRGSSFDQLAERAAAETLLEEAERAERVSAKASKTATTGLGLRTVHRAEIVNRTEFARYVWNQHPDDIAEFLTALAPRLVSRGLRNMPGVVVHEEKVAV